MIDERSTVEESQLREQHCVHEWHRGELLQVDFHREFVLLLFHHEGHLTETETLHFDRDSFARLHLLLAKISSGGVPDFRPPLIRKSTSGERARYTTRAGKAIIVH